ncbi:hypothetical protein M0R04_09585 [Candidatus Dojkabacteria bacterium]|jgi:hypothetical protein|nr:hypothetical protein [Candidatus Dojkabacteria bacterium]
MSKITLTRFDAYCFTLFGLFYFLIFLPLVVPAFLITDRLVITPALVSSYIDCYSSNLTESVEQANRELLAPLGLKTEVAGLYNPKTNKISLNTNDPETIKHEYCHREQHLANRSFSCQSKIGVFVNEVECYIRQYYMDYLNVSEIETEKINK